MNDVKFLYPKSDSLSILYISLIAFFFANMAFGSIAKATAHESGINKISGQAFSTADSCKLGPKLLSVSNISTSYLNGQFYGLDVFEFSWFIKDLKGNILRQGEESPVNSNPLLTFKPLPAGKYTLTYLGKSCVSAPSTMAFTITSPSRSVDNSARMGAFSPATIAKGMDEHMELSISWHDDIYLVTDNATATAGDGYEFRYMIGAEVVTSEKPLKNYVFAGNNPLRIWKMKTQKGLESTARWSDKENNGYFSTKAGESFSYNTTAAFNTFVFPALHGKGFINPIPSNYNPATQVAQWADIAPDMKLPKGHVWVATRGKWSSETLLAKGATHIPHHQLPWENESKVKQLKDAGHTYNNVPRTEHFLHLKENGTDRTKDGYNAKYWPNGPLTREQAIQKANEADISDAIWIGETMEGASFMSAESEMWAHFYKRLNERYQEKWGTRNIPYYIAHNYFMFWPSEMSLSRSKAKDHYKQLLRLKGSALPKTNFSPGGSLSSTTLIPEAVYIGAPDVQQGQVYEAVYKMQVIHNMGYETGIFLFGVHEWRPNNLYQYNYPEGKFYSYNKLPLDPNVIIANGFIAQIFGKMYIEWGGSGKTIVKNFDSEWGKGLWYPTGSQEPQNGFPYYAKPQTESYPGYTGSDDLSYFSQKLYNDTFGRVTGGSRKYLKYRIDNGKWITPSQYSAEEIVDAYYDKRGFVFSETKNGQTAWFYLNSFADNKWHQLEVELPNGSIAKERVAGNGIHAKMN
ncbi:hypothetical protein [Dyadobacter sp. CY312]|uniref:hypothetical protein n=1 Tax=Dyadobacter sp. CY312 TaxID=2907303 RepID=UPI001F1EB1EB|nr:hypothetical protein [Dyadobacter sp. CY312]MCE7042429.1 hypothetical protein [Dyadobacter sp. CY312]